MEYVELFETQNPGELALIKSLLDANRIECFVKNEHLGGLYSLPVLPCVVMVQPVDLKRAQTLLSLLHAREGGKKPEKRGQVVFLPHQR